MCPTIIYKDGKPVVVLGAGNHASHLLLTGGLNILDFGMSASEATHAAASIARQTIFAVTPASRICLCGSASATPIMRLAQPRRFWTVHAITIDPSSGSWLAVRIWVRMEWLV
jgi:gamma-glutamyltranspeptidase